MASSYVAVRGATESQHARQLEKLGLSYSEAFDKAQRDLIPNKRSKDVKPIQDGNVVTVEFGGPS